MRKVFQGVFIIAITTIFLQLFMFYNNYEYLNIFYNKTSIHFSYDEYMNTAEFNYKFIDELIDFSNSNNINISQYNYVGDQELSIYCTNLEKEWNLLEGSLPKGENYVGNGKALSNKQSGKIYSAFTSQKIKIWDIEQVRNVGLKNKFYISTDNSVIIDSFINEFSKYGDIEIGVEYVNSMVLNNATFLSISIFMLVLLCISICVYIFTYYKKIIIMNLWGYSNIKTVINIAKNFRFFIILFMILNLFLIIFYSIQNVKIEKIAQNLGIIILMQLFLLFVMMLLINLIIIIIKSKLALSEKKTVISLSILNLLFKLFVFIAIIFVADKLYNNFVQLQIKQASYGIWEKNSENIFKIIYTELDDEVNNDFSKDNDLNRRLEHFYQLLDKEFGGMLIHSDNFYVAERAGEEITYLYEYATDDMFAFNGHRITVNKNYLEYNTIQNVNDGNVISDLRYDKNILNLLIPEKYKAYEEIIRNEYIREYYFQKVEVDNMYNEELGLPVNNTVREELSLNIIYIKDNQEFFTYNVLNGNDSNMIVDPIVVIYTGGMHNSYIGALVTSSLFYKSDSSDNAYQELNDIIIEAGVPEITMVSSVYSELGEEIARIEQKTMQNIMSSFTLLAFLIVIVILYSWLNYNLKAYKISIKYIWGYSYLKIYCIPILINILISVLSICIYIVGQLSRHKSKEFLMNQYQ